LGDMFGGRLFGSLSRKKRETEEGKAHRWTSQHTVGGKRVTWKLSTDPGFVQKLDVNGTWYSMKFLFQQLFCSQFN